MARPTKSLRARDRLGVYKALDEVPNHHLFHHHGAAYAGRDVWQEFCEEHEYEQGNYDRYEEEVDRVGGHWRGFMDGRGRHHALATPSDIEEWCVGLLAEKSVRRTYDFFVRIDRFYDWLQWHTDHPHVYNPVLMAAVDGEAAGRAWAYKAAKHRERRERYRAQS